ncbi:MAG: glutathione peroxidase [Rhodospirillales bacterium]|nr:MAG: glutathione peroxidase [Rhodospirillales bacterium]
MRGSKMRMRAIMILLGLVAAAAPASAEGAGKSAHDFTFTAIEGGPLPLSDFRGKVVMVVNTASFCGFTRQYDGLQAVWERYRDRGLIVLGVPSNDFGNQEPGTEDEIKRFCEVNFNIDFPMTSKVPVKGADAHPFYMWAAGEVGDAGTPRWNFHKYLIGPEGELVAWFSTRTEPTSREVAVAIEAQLARIERAGG